MAHVLLPCDLPTWPDVQRHLSQLRLCQDADQLVAGMSKLYDICSISLDPEDMYPKGDLTRFEDFHKFLVETLNDEERKKFFTETLPGLVSHALRLKLVKPENGFHYSLIKEDATFSLGRRFVMSLLANAFFSTFPRRSPKTHPTLQDFSFGEFFRYMTLPNHQQKLQSFFQYFEICDAHQKGIVRFCRKVLEGQILPSLPGWLCSDRPLVPLIVRYEGNMQDAETDLYRACPCSPAVGGDVLQTASSQEASLFFKLPELLVCLCFVECLRDNEALLVDGVLAGQAKLQNSQNEVNLCLLDATDFSSNLLQQYEDRYLLRELTKALAAFTQPLTPRRQTPVGESSSSSTCPDRCSSRHTSRKTQTSSKTSSRASSVKKVPRCNEKGDPKSASSSSQSKCPSLPPITVSGDVFHESHSSQSSANDQSWLSTHSAPTKSAKLPEQVKLPKKGIVQKGSRSLSGASSKWSSLKTASQSSCELPPIKLQRSAPGTHDDEYYTADEDSEEGSEGRKKKTLPRIQNLEPPQPTRQLSDVSRQSRTDSMGFVLDGSDDDEYNLNKHERLEDFRKRIRRRTRHLSRRSSRSSYVSSSGSSDMDDISEDPELGNYSNLPIRPTSSEPSLLQLEYGDPILLPPFSLPPEAVLLSLGGKKMMVTTSNGQLKAYSYDGVNPNLPVPFKAKFRRRHHSADRKDNKRDEDIFWYVPPPSRSAVTSTASSEEDVSRETSTDAPLSTYFKGKRMEADATNELLLCAADGKRPVAASTWGCGTLAGDFQLKAMIQWLAASMAGLPSLVFYTAQEPTLNEMPTVYRKVLERHWSVGDLACEVLRFCRNRLSTRQRVGMSPMLFAQLLGSGASSYISQHSLD